MSRSGEHVINVEKKCLTCGRTKEGGCLCRPSRTVRKAGKVATVKFRAGHERAEKAKVRQRDSGCRFPLCGCRKLGLQVKARREVSHDRHKGMGGNPIGDRSTASEMVQLCTHRHQDARFSRHKGTIRAFKQTSMGYSGAVDWYAEAETLIRHFPHLGKMTLAYRTWPDGWQGVALAYETMPGHLAPLADWQREVLDVLAEMDL